MTQEAPMRTGVRPAQKQAFSNAPSGREKEAELKTTAPKEDVDKTSEFTARVQQVEDSLGQDLPTSLRPVGKQPAPPFPTPGDEKRIDWTINDKATTPNDGLGVPSEFMALVHELEGSFAGDLPTGFEDSIPWRADEVPGENPTVRTESFEECPSKLESDLENVPEGLQEGVDAAVAAVNEKLDSELRQFVAESERSTAEMVASGQLLLTETRRQMAAVMQSLLDSLIKAATETTRAELDVARKNVIEQTQREIASMTRLSLKPLMEEAVEQVRAELQTSRRVLVEDTEVQLARITQTLLQGVQFIKNVMEQVRAELRASRRTVVEETQNQLARVAQSSLQGPQSTDHRPRRADWGES